MLDETVGHYRLTERLGAGAMGEVYLAQDLRLHRPVALKMLPAEAAGDEAASARLVREARVASSLNHPNIAVIYEIGEAERDGRRHGFIAMEYVAGRTLAEIARERRLEVAEALGFARQVAEALAEAHDRGVVHRDVKPGNVMIDARGQVKVLDFGLAKFAPAESDQLATWSGRHRVLEEPGAVMGTVAYMSPEQARGDEIDARSDVFSLGVLLYELLTGVRPFQGRNAIELIDKVLREAPPALVRDALPLPAEIGRVVLRMLEKDKARRHPDMRAVCRDFEALLAGRAPELLPAAEEDVRLAVLSFANITRGPEDDWLGTGIAETLTAALSAIPGLTVLGRERVIEVLRKLGPEQGDEQALAARLGHDLQVRLVVSGGYQRVGEQVRVTARVTEALSGRVSEVVKLDGRMAELFELQDRIAGELSAGLRLRLPARRDPDSTHNVLAYEAFAKGLLNLRAESTDALDRAILFFEQAVALDPTYARAHAQLGAAYETKGDYLSMPGLASRALESLDRAIALRPNLAEAWRMRGSALLALCREDEAQASVEHALALNPGEAASYTTLGRIHFVGHGDFARAAEWHERTLALNPQAGWSALQLAQCAALAGDLPRAESAARRAVVLQEEFMSGQQGLLIVGAYVRLGQVYALKGLHAEALQQFEREVDFLKRVDHALRARIFIELHQRMGASRLRLGDQAGGRAELDLCLEAFERRVRTGADDPSTRYYAACAYALRGETDCALDCLERAAAMRRRFTVARARREAALDVLHDEPRFRALLDGTQGQPATVGKA